MKYLLNVATLSLSDEKCSGCGACIQVCPHGVLTLANKKAVITDKDLCMECGACMTNCAFGAVIVNKGVGCAAALINGMITGGEPTCGCSGGAGEKNCC